MGKIFDFLVSSVFDLSIKNGDFEVGESTLQNQKFLLLAEKGEYKQDPTIGVGLVNSIDDDKSGAEIQSEIQTEFEKDGMTITKLNARSLENIEIEAEYGQDDNS